MDAQAWTDFFKEAGLGPEVAATYGNIFFMNKIKRSHLPYLNREVLGEMNISVLGHILMILKHARLVSDRVKCPTSAATLATSSESEDQINPTVETRQEIEGSASVSDTQSEVQQSHLDSRGGSQTIKQSPTRKQDCEMEDSVVAEASVGKDCEKDPCEEALKCADKVSQSEKSELSSKPDSVKKVNTGESTDSLGVDEGDEKDATAEQHSLLPTPPMPHNWLDPSRKHLESDEDDKDVSDIIATHEGQDESNPEDSQREQENKNIISAYSQENEPERPAILPEKICSPLLPTPVMPENWLDPSRRSADGSFTAFFERGQAAPFFQNECGGNLPSSSFLPEANVNVNDNFISSTAATYTDPLCPQASLFPNDNSQTQNNSTFDAYAEYNDQTMQDRNFKAKSNPVWNKQARQAQPYYRPQPQSTYGASNYTPQLNERPGFQSNAPGTLNMNSGYMYNTQSTNERREVQQWKY